MSFCRFHMYQRVHYGTLNMPQAGFEPGSSEPLYLNLSDDLNHLATTAGFVMMGYWYFNSCEFQSYMNRISLFMNCTDFTFISLFFNFKAFLGPLSNKYNFLKGINNFSSQPKMRKIFCLNYFSHHCLSSN